jgi:sulfur-carrier protein adenylyltransferase/sulfurtransferase
MPLSTDELRRYSRHLAIPGFGLEAQERLKASRVLLIGTGGLGSPAALYLAAAGVGTLGLVDADVVDVSNLQRQILHGQSDIGRAKLDSAADRLREVNPHVQLQLHREMFTAANAMRIAKDYDLILDGTDNFPTRYLSNDIAVWLRIPNVYGSILRFDGQVGVFAPHLGGPCYRCMAPQPPAPGLVPTCAEGGVLGALPGIVGSMQALESIKLLCGIGEPLVGRLLHIDTLSMKFRSFQLPRDPDCAVCGSSPTITEPIDYQGFCGLGAAHTAMSAPSLPTLTVVELHCLRQADEPHFLIDVREPHEYAVARIDGATLLPLGELPGRLAEIPRDQRIIVHCKLGGRSAKAAQHLLDQGFPNVWNVEGGITAWSKEVDSTVPLY